MLQKMAETLDFILERILLAAFWPITEFDSKMGIFVTIAPRNAGPALLLKMSIPDRRRPAPRARDKSARETARCSATDTLKFA
jgi:hypothetical protein